MARKELSPAEKAKKAEERDAMVKDMHGKIAEAVENIASSEDWKKFLTFGAQFHRYSFNNQMLIRIEGMLRGWDRVGKVASAKAWKDAGDHWIVKGEKAIRIFAPIIVPIKEGEKGYVPGERRTRVVGFRGVPVFSQNQVTNQDKIPADPTAGMFGQEVTGDVREGVLATLITFAKDAGYSYRYGQSSDLNGAEAHTDPQAHEIVMHVRWMGTPREIAIMVHEVAHMLLHTGKDEDGNAPFDYRAHRGVAETEAEGTAFVVATWLGLDMASTSAGYIAGWGKGDPDVIVKAGTRIMATAKKIIAAIED